jgi:hypothetical protein
MENIKVEVAKIDGRTLNTRDGAVKLFNFFLGDRFYFKAPIILDFTNVEFMSRSFADQFYLLKKNWEYGNNIKIELQNYNKQIAEILEAVSNTQYSQENKRNIKSEIKELQFGELKQFEEYLLAI